MFQLIRQSRALIYQGYYKLAYSILNYLLLLLHQIDNFFCGSLLKKSASEHWARWSGFCVSRI